MLKAAFIMRTFGPHGKCRRYHNEGESTGPQLRDTADWKGWLVFFLRGVAEVSLQAAETARRILELREDHRRRITDHLGRAAGNGHRVLERLYERPIMSVSEVRALIRTTFPAANQIVQRLVDLDILKEFTDRARHRRFCYDGMSASSTMTPEADRDSAKCGVLSAEYESGVQSTQCGAECESAE
jgi:hypothetical protein